MPRTVGEVIKLHEQMKNDLEQMKSNLLKIVLAPVQYNEQAIKTAMESVYSCEEVYNKFLQSRVDIKETR